MAHDSVWYGIEHGYYGICQRHRIVHGFALKISHLIMPQNDFRNSSHGITPVLQRYMIVVNYTVFNQAIAKKSSLLHCRIRMDTSACCPSFIRRK